MAATPAQVAQLRRLCNEPTTDTYSDADLTALIEQFPLTDQNGEDQFVWNPFPTTPPSQVANPAWTPTYDMHAAAAQIWEERAAILAQDFDFSADGGTYSRSQPYEQAKAQALWHLSRRAPGSTKVVISPPSRVPLVWLANQPEPP